MTKTVLLTAKTTLGYKRQRLGLDMQFHADEEDVDRLVSSGQAEVTPAPDAKASRPSAARTEPPLDKKPA